MARRLLGACLLARAARLTGHDEALVDQSTLWHNVLNDAPMRKVPEKEAIMALMDCPELNHRASDSSTACPTHDFGIIGRDGLYDQMRDLAHDSDRGVRLKVAVNPYAPSDILRALADDESSFVVDGVAMNPAAPPDLLYRLAKSNVTVSEIAAANPATPPELLRAIVDNEQEFGWGALNGVAKNPSAPPDLLRLLSRRGNFIMRQDVAKNPSTPVDVIRTLAFDQERAHPSFTDSAWVATAALENPSIPIDLLRSFVDDKRKSIQCSIARNPSTPGDILRELAYDSSDWLRQKTAAHNPSCPQDVLRGLYLESIRLHNGPLQEAIAGNPSSEQDILLYLYRYGLPDDVNHALARNTSSPPEVLFLLYPIDELSCLVAMNPSTPMGTLRIMLESPNRYIQAAALSNPALFE